MSTNQVCDNLEYTILACAPWPARPVNVYFCLKKAAMLRPKKKGQLFFFLFFCFVFFFFWKEKEQPQVPCYWRDIRVPSGHSWTCVQFTNQGRVYSAQHGLGLSPENISCSWIWDEICLTFFELLSLNLPSNGPEIARKIVNVNKLSQVHMEVFFSYSKTALNS